MTYINIGRNEIRLLITAIDTHIKSLERREDRFGSKVKLYDELIAEYEKLKNDFIKMR